MERTRKGGDQKNAGPPDDTWKAVGRYLQMLIRNRLQEDTTLTQLEIANRAGISRPNVNYILHKGQVPGLKVLFGLARYFGVAPGVLVDRALSWWEAEGRGEYAHEFEREAAQARARNDTKRSGEHPSARALPVAAPAANKKDR